MPHEIRVLAVAVLIVGAVFVATSGAGPAQPRRRAPGLVLTTKVAGTHRSASSGANRPGSGRRHDPVPSRSRPAPARSACPDSRFGKLPQTDAVPSNTTAAFRCEMRALWAGIQTGRLKPALPAFFPEAAYAQLKAIGDPQGDWSNRLVAEYAQDIEAAHALLGSGAARARFVEVIAPRSLAHVIGPGICYNSLSYWETPNSRLVYREGGSERSFGIASMISWRGDWFVVHLGAILRSGYGGEVDDPSAGAGVAAPSSTC